MSSIRACLLDIDGVLVQDGRALPGAVEAVNFLRQAEIPFCLLTNSTIRPASAWSALLGEQGFSVNAAEILTPVSVAADLLRSRGIERGWWLVREELRGEFAGLQYDETNPQAVVIGDIGERWDYPLLNRVFCRLIEGAILVALHKGRYWKQAGELVLDIGAFVAGLEYAAGVEALVVGKPAPAFFACAVARLGCSAAEAAMFGDDLLSDVGGAQAAGLQGGLVKTGKFRPEELEAGAVRADYVLESIGELPALLRRWGPGSR